MSPENRSTAPLRGCRSSLDVDDTFEVEKMNKSKFKIGDLVQLSAAGRRSNQNHQFDYDGAWGMVVRFDEHNQYPILCHWFSDVRRFCGPNDHATFKEYELKRYRK